MKIRNKQCMTCPWRREVVPAEQIPGYSEEMHRELSSTIAAPACLRDLDAPLRVMACHESAERDEYPCVGWLAHQLGPGNNLALRIQAMDGRYQDLTTIGPQWDTFEETLGNNPKDMGRHRVDPHRGES